jgi:hypothetical protein
LSIEEISDLISGQLSVDMGLPPDSKVVEKYTMELLETGTLEYFGINVVRQFILGSFSTETQYKLFERHCTYPDSSEWTDLSEIKW